MSGIHINQWAISAFICFICFGCNRSNEPQNLGRKTNAEKKIPIEGRILSALLKFEDSSLAFRMQYKWRPMKDIKGEYGMLFDTPIDSQRISPGDQIYIAIFDKYRLPPQIKKNELNDAPAELVGRFIANQDTSNRFEYQIEGRHKYLYVNEELLRKPNFTIGGMHNKYVDKYCRIGFSKPILSNDSTNSLVYMESYCIDGGAIYHLKKFQEDWIVAKKVTLDWKYYHSID